VTAADPAMPRRRFLGQSAAVGAYIATTRLARAQNSGGARRLGIGFIGCGGRAGAHLHMAKRLRDQLKLPVDLVACCDIYRPRREKFKQAGGLANAYDAHQKLLADPAVDLVCIATPDHHHAHQALDAVKAGKHVYCEKPVSHWSQYEATRALADAVAASKTAFVCGTQAMSDPAWMEMKKLIRSGLIGQPIHAETGFFRTGDWGERGMPIDDPKLQPGPDLDWDAFLAPDRPQVPFSVDRLFRWRLFEDYAGGPVTDLYPHSLAQVVDMLDLTFPERVTGIGSVSRYPYELRSVPDTFHLIAQFPQGFSLTLQGTQGNNHQAVPQRGAGQRTPVIRGWDGTLSIDPNNREILFLATEGSPRKPAVQRFPIPGGEDNLMLWKNLVECALAGRQDTWSPMDLAFRTQTILQMAMFSHKQNKTAAFDPAKRAIVI
jgi:predicted dehydrogenase